MTVRVVVIEGRMALMLGEGKVMRGEHGSGALGQPYVEITREEAGDLIEHLCTGVGQMEGHREAQLGKGSGPVDCPHCAARRVAPGHECRRTTRRKR